MIFESKSVTLKDGRKAVLRTPTREDAIPLLEMIRRISGETNFILRYPEEFDEYTEESEIAFLEGMNESPNSCLITAEIDGKPAGNCQVRRNSAIKTRHRVEVAIGILEEYWGLGLGTAFFTAMIDVAKGWGCAQIELDFVEGNTRARALYEKMGFAITGVKPDAIRLKDGTLLREYSMVKSLESK